MSKKEFFNLQNYLHIHDIAITQQDIGEKTKIYFRKKGILLGNLIDELQIKGFLKHVDKNVTDNINKVSEVTLKNFDQLKNMTQSYLNVIDKKLDIKYDVSTIILRDSDEEKHHFTAHQVGILIGLTYSAFCELLRQFFILIIDFEIMGYDKEPTGLGRLIWMLENKKIKKLEFFYDIDTRVRNSFAHFDFKFDGDKLYCKNNPKAYEENEWRNSLDNSQKDYILLSDLFMLLKKLDGSTYSLMHACIHMQKKAEYN